MAGIVESVSNAETMKTLAGAADLPRFTIDALAKYVDVPRSTVDAIRRRYSDLFERVGPVSRRGRDRPPVQWRLRWDRVDEVGQVVDRLRASPSPAEIAAMKSVPDGQT